MCKAKFVAIKTDVSKAYDRVEWNFLEALLLKMGFDEKWVSWIHWCISSVSYQVLINGEPKGTSLRLEACNKAIHYPPLSSF